MGLFVKLYAAIVRKRIENDPILRGHLKAANEIGKEIQKDIDQRRKEDPELDKWMSEHPL